MDLPVYNYWEDKFFVELKEAKSFGDVGDIAVSVIKTIPKPRYAISAPLTTGGFGLENNKKVIKNCILKLNAKGFNTFDILPLELAIKPLKDRYMKFNPRAKYCMPILDNTYRKIFKYGDFDAVFRTQNWKSSFGCYGEENLFKQFKILVQPFPKEWYLEIIESLEIKEYSEVVSI